MKTTEIYILLETYEPKDVLFFRRNYLTDFVGNSEYYEYPQYRGETEFETTDVDQMINYVLNNKGRSYRFYLKPQADIQEINLGMMFFNADNSLILGVLVSSNQKNEYVNRLQRDFNSHFVLVVDEMSPPSSAKAFKDLVDNITDQ